MLASIIFYRLDRRFITTEPSGTLIGALIDNSPSLCWRHDVLAWSKDVVGWYVKYVIGGVVMCNNNNNDKKRH